MNVLLECFEGTFTAILQFLLTTQGLMGVLDVQFEDLCLTGTILLW